MASENQLSPESVQPFIPLIKFYKEYMNSICNLKLEDVKVTEFDKELIKSCKFLLRFGIITHKPGNENNEELNKMFAYLCHILKKFTETKKVDAQHDLETLSQKESAVDKFEVENPLTNSVNDIKIRLFNKRDWKTENNSKNKESDQGLIHTNIIKEIMEMFHLIIDLRQEFIMIFCVMSFDDKIMKTKNASEHKIEIKDIHKEVVKEYLKIFVDGITTSAEFTELKDRIRRLDQIYYEEYLKKDYNKQLYMRDKLEHGDFEMLIIDTFNVSSKDHFLSQSALAVLSRVISERAEVIRNLEKILLVFDDQQNLKYKWANKTIETFSTNVDSSALWLDDKDKNHSELYIKATYSALEELYK